MPRPLDEVLTFIRGVLDLETVALKARLTEPSDTVFAQHVTAWLAPFAANARHNGNRGKNPASFYRSKDQRAQAKLVHPRTVFAVGRYAGDVYRVWLGAPLCVPSKDGIKLSYFIEDHRGALTITAHYIACLSCSGSCCSVCRQSGWTYIGGKKLLMKLGPLEDLQKLAVPTMKRSLPAYEAIVVAAAPARRPARPRAKR